MSNTPTEGSVLFEWLRERFTRSRAEAVAGEDKPRRRWRAITVCVLIAVVLWFTLSIRETYTIEVEAFSFGPLTTLQVLDLLPLGVAGASYLPGSTVITNPDLTQVTGAAADPAISTVGARDQPAAGRQR